MVQTVESSEWHAMPVDEVAVQLRTDIKTGLTQSEADERLQSFGLNQVTKGQRRSRLKMFLRQLTSPLVVILLASAGITLMLRDFVDAGVILAVVLANAVIGFVQEDKAESAIESLSKLLTIEAAVLREGSTRRIPSQQVVPGDIVILEVGDKVPADARLCQEKGLRIDESALTGESAPVSKSSDPVDAGESLPDRVCMVYSGTLVTAGSARAIVVATGDSTELGRISKLISSSPEIGTPLTRKLEHFGKWLTAAILLVSGTAFAVGVALGRGAAAMFSASVAIAVAMIPEGLPAIVTIILAVGVKRMVARNAVIRTLPSVETLGSVTVICSDKTGTLTTNEMTVSHALAGGREYEFTGTGYDPSCCGVAAVDTDAAELTAPAFIELMRCGVLCNNSALAQRDGGYYPEGDPTEVALLVAAVKAGLDPEEERRSHKRVDVVPFESSHMYMATLNETMNGGRAIYVKGAVERLLGMCSLQMAGVEQQELDVERIQRRAGDLAAQGFRVLAFAWKSLPADTDTLSIGDLKDLTFLGLQAMSDPARPEAIAAVRECAEAGIDVKMITGDHLATARAVARDVGIGGTDARSISGAELDSLPEEDFDRVACSSSVFARVSPEQKYRLVQALQGRGEVVAMTGDGVNDAPALKKADIGVAMGQAGSDVAKDASDMVLADDNFATIVAAVEEGRTVFSNLLKTLAYILPTNLGEGLVIIVALLGGYTLPVTPVQILWVNTVTAITLALPLAFEPQEPGTMKLPPRNPGAPIFSGALLQRLLTVGLYMVLASFWVFAIERARGASLAESRTAAVGTIVAIELFYLFVARSGRVPVWRIGLFSNPYVWVGVLLVVLLQLAFSYLPILNVFFGSSPLPGWVWLNIVLLSLPVVVLVGLEQAIRRRFSAQGSESSAGCALS